MPKTYRLGQLILISAALSMTAMVTSASAQALPADDNNPVDNTKSSQFGIALPDSNAAADLLKKAATEEIQKHWDTAADLYFQAITQYPNRVVPVNQDKGFSHYSGIAEVVQERLSKWPAEGLATYNDLYGKTAHDLLRAVKPGDVGMLSNIFYTYFATDSGKSAGIQLMDVYLENGDFRAAQRIGSLLLRFHPALKNDRSMIVYRTALANHYAGNDASASELLSQLKTDDPESVGSIGGKDTSLVDSLTAVLKAPAQGPTTRPSDADTYPGFGGFDGCGDISVSSAKFGTSQIRVPLSLPEYPGASGARLAVFQANDRFSANNSLSMTIIPVADDGALFFQDGRSLYAIDPDTGAPLPGWLKTYPDVRNGRYKFSAFGRPRNELLTVTVTPGAVLAVMGQADPLAAPFVAHGQQPPPPPPSTVKLVCLDRNTGRELWTRSPAGIPDSHGVLAKSEYDGAPLVIPATYSRRSDTGPAEDSVLVTARTGRGNEFDDCYVVSLSLKSGTFLWSTYLGGATHNQRAHGNSSQMAFANGQVFVMTNLGVIAALNPADGRLIWLNSYPHDPGQNLEEALFQNSQGGIQAGGRSATPGWEHNPVFVSDGNVFVLPNDTTTLFACDANTGLTLARLPMSDWDDANQLLGVRDGLIHFCSDRKVFSVDWRNYNSQAKATDVTRFTTDISFLDMSKICGRGFVTADSIFIPTTDRLVQIIRGRVKATFPPTGAFNENQSPGNILATSHDIIVACQTHIDIYSNQSSKSCR